MKFLKYTVKSIIEQNKRNFLFFWRHFCDWNGKITQNCLSQWFEREFIVDNITYFTAEQYMMAEKARLFGDLETLYYILNTYSPREVKEFGRKIKNFYEKIWFLHKEEIVFNGNVAKFSQNEDLACFLLNTDDKFLVEASPFDKIWGVGLSKEDSRITDPNKWLGKNLLGFILVGVRDELRKNSLK